MLSTHGRSAGLRSSTNLPEHPSNTFVTNDQPGSYIYIHHGQEPGIRQRRRLSDIASSTEEDAGGFYESRDRGADNDPSGRGVLFPDFSDIQRRDEDPFIFSFMRFAAAIAQRRLALCYQWDMGEWENGGWEWEVN